MVLEFETFSFVIFGDFVVVQEKEKFSFIIQKITGKEKINCII